MERSFEKAVALTAIVLLAPLLIAIAFMPKRESGVSAFVRRSGLDKLRQLSGVAAEDASLNGPRPRAA